MDKSKEDILEDYESLRVMTDYDFYEEAWVKGCVEQAMDEYARNIAIDFFNDAFSEIVVNGIRIADHFKPDTEKLFDIYTQSKQP